MTARVPYQLTGTAHYGTIAVLGGISAHRHVERWWSEQVGPDAALDTNLYAVLGIDYLGAHLERGAVVPRVDTRDQARALLSVLDHLGIAKLSAIVGSSYGGMVALAFGALFPERVEKLIVIGAAHEPHPMATALRSIQRNIVALAQSAGRADEGLDLARQLAMTTYRTAEEFADRFDGRNRVEDYLAYCGQKYVEAFTPERFLCLSQSIDTHCVRPAEVRVPTTFVAIEGDAIAPPWQIRVLAEQLGGHANVIEIRSRFGHDAFLKESAAISNILRKSILQEVCT